MLFVERDKKYAISYPFFPKNFLIKKISIFLIFVEAIIQFATMTNLKAYSKSRLLATYLFYWLLVVYIVLVQLECLQIKAIGSTDIDII